MYRLLYVLTSVIIVVSTVGGCKRHPDLSNVPGQIPLKIWVVHGPNDTPAAPVPGGPMVCVHDNQTPCSVDSDCDRWSPDSPPVLMKGECAVQHYGRDNAGCRLSEAEILARVGQLQANNSVYGGVNFVHPPPPPELPITIVIDDAIDHPRKKLPLAFSVYEPIIENNWDVGKLNIYFAGNVASPQGQEASAFANDPRDDPPNGRAYVLINDGGQFIEGKTGFHEQLIPSKVKANRVLEHEVGHFLLDRRNCTSYDSAEHKKFTNNHLMNKLGGIIQYPLILTQGEKAEIQCRYVSGAWALASDNCRPDPCP